MNDVDGVPKNLDKLLDVINKIIELKKPIDMGDFRTNPEGYTVGVYDYASTEEYFCNTVGCILGYCPQLGEGELSYEGSGLAIRNIWFWEDYSEKVFSLLYYSHAWIWLFSDYWQNCPHAARERVEYLIEHGTPPSSFDYRHYEPFKCPRSEWPTED